MPLQAAILEDFLQNLVARSATRGPFSSQASGEGERARLLQVPCFLFLLCRWSSLSCMLSLPWTVSPDPCHPPAPSFMGTWAPCPVLSDLPWREPSVTPILPGTRHRPWAGSSAHFPCLWSEFPVGEN